MILLSAWTLDMMRACHSGWTRRIGLLVAPVLAVFLAILLRRGKPISASKLERQALDGSKLANTLKSCEAITSFHRVELLGKSALYAQVGTRCVVPILIKSLLCLGLQAATHRVVADTSIWAVLHSPPPEVQPLAAERLSLLPAFHGSYRNRTLWGTYRPGLYFG